MNADERLIWRYLRGVAAARPPATTTYLDLSAHLCEVTNGRLDFKPPFHALFPMLGNVSRHELRMGRPLLSVLVVSKETQVPGKGFYGMARGLGLSVQDEDAFFESQLAAVRAFWSVADPLEVMDDALANVLDRLDEIRKLLR